MTDALANSTPAPTGIVITIPQPPTRTPHLDRLDNIRMSFIVDPDILLACEDQARSQGITVQEWFQQTCNDALKTYLGV